MLQRSARVGRFKKSLDVLTKISIGAEKKILKEGGQGSSSVYSLQAMFRDGIDPQARMIAQYQRPDLATLIKPSEPEDGDCCERGCVHCVWEEYAFKLEEYQERLRASR